jgi:hypothetical protein
VAQLLKEASPEAGTYPLATEPTTRA